MNDVINTISELDEPLAEIENNDEDSKLIATFPITELFDIERGSGKYTRSYVQNHKGQYLLFLAILPENLRGLILLITIRLHCLGQ